MTKAAVSDRCRHATRNPRRHRGGQSRAGRGADQDGRVGRLPLRPVGPERHHPDADADRARPRRRRHGGRGRRRRDRGRSRRPRRAVVRPQLRATATSAIAARVACARRARWPSWAACSTAPPGSPPAGAPLHQMAMLGTFGDEAIVPEISVVKIDKSTCRSRSPPSSAAACSPAWARRTNTASSAKATPWPSSAAAASAST